MFVYILFLLSSFNFSSEPNDIILKSMKEELSRFFSQLKGKTEYPVYFLGYEAWKSNGWNVSVKMDAVAYENEWDNLIAVCDARVGTPQLDSTHEIKSQDDNDNIKRIDSMLISMDSTDAIKSDLWILADKAVKDVIERYTKVIANKNITAEEEDKSGDFIYDVGVSTYYNLIENEKFDRKRIIEILKNLSSDMKNYSFLIDGFIRFGFSNDTRYIVNSQGTSIVEGERKYYLIWELYSRSHDGTDLSVYRSYHFKNINDMPDYKKLNLEFKNDILTLDRQLKAPNLAPYSGPAILKNRAASVFWHEIFGHRIEGHRQKGEREGHTFADKIGKQIMPSFINIYDDPTLEYYKGFFLNGHYIYDDEGVKSSKTVLVENGILKNFLMQRVPVRGINISNGHGRRSSGYMSVARQGNLIIEFKNPVSYDELEKKLIELIKISGKPYGLIINDIEGGYTYTQRTMPQSYTILIKDAVKVYPDGRKETIKGLNMVGTPLQTFSKIIAASDDYAVFNGSCGAESGWVDVSAVSGSILFSEVETQKITKSSKKPPLLPPPHSEKTK